MSSELVPLRTNGDLVGEVAGVSAPKMSFPGFRTLLDRLRDEGLPQVFDRSFFGEYSGSLIALIRQTLRFFDLIDEDKRPTERLRALARMDDEERIATLRALAEEKYAAVIALGSDATQGQLIDVFRARGLSGDSVTKAITFYMGFAEYVGLPVSPYFRRASARASVGAVSSSRRARSQRRKPSSPPEPPSAEAVPRVMASPLEAQRSAYIDLLMKLVEQGADKGEVQDSLLDRLERALKYDSSPKKGEE